MVQERPSGGGVALDQTTRLAHDVRGGRRDCPGDDTGRRGGADLSRPRPILRMVARPRLLVLESRADAAHNLVAVLDGVQLLDAVTPAGHRARVRGVSQVSVPVRLASSWARAHPPPNVRRCAGRSDMSHAGPASTDLLEAAAPRLPALRAPRTTVTCRDGLVACVGALGRRHEARNSWEHPAPRRQGHDDATAKAPVACHAAARGCGDPGGRSTVGVAPGRERSRRGQQGEGALDGAGRRSPRSGRASGLQPWRSCSGGGRSWCLTVSSLSSPHRRWDPFHWWVGHRHNPMTCTNRPSLVAVPHAKRRIPTDDHGCRTLTRCDSGQGGLPGWRADVPGHPRHL